MAKWSLFKKLKPENEDITIKETKIIDEEEYKQTHEPLAEYKETLYVNKPINLLQNIKKHFMQVQNPLKK